MGQPTDCSRACRVLSGTDMYSQVLKSVLPSAQRVLTGTQGVPISGSETPSGSVGSVPADSARCRYLSGTQGVLTRRLRLLCSSHTAVAFARAQRRRPRRPTSATLTRRRVRRRDRRRDRRRVRRRVRRRRCRPFQAVRAFCIPSTPTEPSDGARGVCHGCWVRCIAARVRTTRARSVRRYGAPIPRLYQEGTARYSDKVPWLDKKSARGHSRALPRWPAVGSGGGLGTRWVPACVAAAASPRAARAMPP